MRTMIAAAAILTLLAATLGPAAAQPQPVRIAFLSSLSGPFAFWGVNARDGMKMAVAEVNAGGGVLGRPLELVERDDRNNPAEAITAFRSLVERDRIVAAGGVISSDVALAAAREAESLRVPLFLTMAGSHAILTRRTRFTFRTCLVAAPMYVQAIAGMVQREKYTRVGAIVADYAWGHSIREAFERYVAPLPGVRTQQEVAPVVTPDFTPYLRRLQPLNPQLLVAAGHPPGNPTIVRQMWELGMTAPVIGSVLPPELMVQRAGDAVYGRFQDYSCVDFQNPTWARLAARFHTEYKRYFDNSALSGYVIVKMVADAARRAKSTDPPVLADTIRKGRFIQAGHGWPLSYTEWGEMKEARPIIFVIERGEAPGGANPGAGWFQKWLFRPPAVEPYVPAE
ncbi:MAG: ABC transporter substrate-binding protein [Armatimonadota bacterium]|nr:ABC transporter substrate-binding protein [Armatimonadota bacterium]MDR7427355.1 ABC transporter substrate-binding protein [Armatimonadota bacterium]MDR7464692.1 ABC transporter substrate-binding protein [Armatimonadota bacterium]MDR7468701.1 ABC transporter substrate-binding protein [Armatimonadota bacterium]MDR7474380.1 ABC transporter substrate-binding protein [Armatimonadota bacterium]